MTNKFSRLTALMALGLAVLFFTSFQIFAAVGDTFVIDDLKYTVLTEEGPTGTVSVKSDSRDISGNVAIPDSVENNGITYGVTSIGYSAFERCSSLANITIPSSVTFIGGSAFKNCNRLKHVYYEGNIPSVQDKSYGIYEDTPETLISYYSAENEESWVPYIVENTWQSRRISNVSGVDYIYNDDGTACVVGIGITDDTDIIIAASVEKEGVTYTVTSISENAFESSNIPTSITIPASITAIKINTFHSCDNLRNIYVDPDNPVYSSVDGVLFNKDQTVLIQYPSGREGEYTLPKSVETIGYYAFAGCTGATSLIILEGMESIENNAFYKFKGLQKIQLPSTLKTIGEDAFFGCVNLQEITIPDSVSNIGAGAFANCRSLEQLDIPNYVKEIGDSAFFGCKKLEFIYIPDSCAEVGAYMFKHCYSLETVVMGAGVKEIPDGFFLGCGKVKEEYYEKASYYGAALNFTHGNLKEIYFLGDNPGITWGAFLIEDDHTSIGTNSAYVTAGLQQREPERWVDPIQGQTPSLYYLKDRAGWYSLSYEEALDEVRNSGWGNLADTLCLCLNYAELKSKENDFEYDGEAILSYKGHSPVVIIPDFVTEISENAFANCESVYVIIVPKSVKAIGDKAFANCPHLKTVQFRGETPTASENIFEESHCVVYYESKISGWNTSWKGTDVLTIEKLTKGDFIYEINNLEVTIAGYVGTSSYLEIPSEINSYPVTRIKENAFLENRNLIKVAIPNSVVEIGDGAFWNCKDLISITIPDSVTSIAENTFSGCSNLCSMIIPESVISIGNNAFAGCNSLKNITIPNSVTSIGDSVFEGCGSLANVIISDGVTSIGNRAFDNCSSLTGVYFEGDVPELGYDVYGSFVYYGYTPTTPATIYYLEGTKGWGKYSSWRRRPEVECKGWITQDGIIYVYKSDGTAIVSGYTRELKEVVISEFISVDSINYSVTSICERVFYNCDCLTNIYVSSNNPRYSSVDGVLFNKYGTLLVQYPAGKEDKIYKIPDSVISIGEYAFSGCTYLSNVFIPNSVKSIRDYAFYGYDGLTSIRIPDSITSIGDYTFVDCNNLTSVYFEGNAPSLVGDSVFANTPATIYYREGTEGWTNPWGGRPSALWVEAPEIIEQPQSQSVVEGNAVIFTVSTTGTVPLNYQWQKDGVDIIGATDACYTVDNVKPTDAGSYTVTVSNSAGSVTSDVATLTVRYLGTATISMNSVNSVIYGDSCGPLAGQKVSSDIWGSLLYNGQEIARQVFTSAAAGKPTGKLKGNVIETDLVPAGTEVTLQLAAFDQGYLDHPNTGHYYYGISKPFTYKTGDSKKIQPDSNLLFDSFTVEWVETPVDEPVIRFELEGDGESLTLDFVGTLYESEDAVTWHPVEGAKAPFKVDITQGKKFYRCAQ